MRRNDLPVEIGENGIHARTPLWAECCQAVEALAHAWRKCAMLIAERRDHATAARPPLGRWLQEELAQTPWPDLLDAVPDPSDGIFLCTYAAIPFSGRWEPIDGAAPPLLRFLFRTPTPRPPFRVAGAMSYLHGGTIAPHITIETAPSQYWQQGNQ
jgi:hypothetical protein